MRNDYRIDKIKKLAHLLYHYNKGNGAFELVLTFAEPPDETTVAKVRQFLTDKTKVEVKVLAPVEKSRLLRARKGWRGYPKPLPKGHPGVFWRVQVPMTVTVELPEPLDAVPTEPEAEPKSPERLQAEAAERVQHERELILRLTMGDAFVEQDYDQEPGP